MKATESSGFVRAGLFFIGCVLIAISPKAMASEPNDLKRIFEQHYERWKAHCQAVELSSKAADRLESPDYRAIVHMGPAVLPYIFDKTRNDEDHGGWVAWAWSPIAGVSMDPSVNAWAKDSIEDWWSGGKNLSKGRFETTFGKWSDLKRQGKLEEADHARKTVLALGIAVLPSFMTKLETDDGQILDAIKDITGGAADTSGETVKQRVKSCRSWWNKNKEKWLIPFPNKTPIANAGQDQNVFPGNTVQLDGSRSNDPDKDSLTYEWTQIGGPTVKLLEGEADRPSFVAPQVTERTTLVFQLVVDDGSPEKEVHSSCKSGRSDPAVVRVTVEPKR